MTVHEGHSAIVDAVYARPTDRQVIERVAADTSVPFVGIWLEAPESTLIARAERRHHDASDADADVIRVQSAQRTGAISWHRVEADRSSEIVLEYAARYVQEQVRRAPNGAC
jgi:predicted kinase